MDTTFSAGTTITSDWLNDVNIAVYRNAADPRHYGAAYNGTTNDTQAILDAATEVGNNGGGAVVIPNGVNVLIDTALTLPPNVHLIGPHAQVGVISNSNTPFNTIKGKLIINPAVSVTIGGGGSVTGFLVVPKGMTFPQANSVSWTGTAFIAGGDDAGLYKSMVLGFNQAFYSLGKQRARVQNNGFDCQNGIYVSNCADISYIKNNHCWPYATIATVSKPSNWADRNIAYRFDTLGDWNKVTDCFSYGYFIGYELSNVNSMTLLSCSADGTQAYAGSTGFYIKTGCHDTRLIGCQAAAQEIGYNVSSSSNIQTRLIGCDAWGITQHGVINYSGDMSILGGVIRNVPQAITVTNASSKIYVDGVRFEAIAGTNPINCTVATSNVFLGKNIEANGWSTAIVGSNLQIPSVASADPLNLPSNGDKFIVTGTTNFGTINHGWAGREVTLIFSGVLTVFDGGATVKLNGNFTSTANSVLRLMHDGSVWNEVSRSVN